MTALIDIGEVVISDARAGGKDYLLRPSFEAMNRIGTPAEIVQAYATIHGQEFSMLTDLYSRAPAMAKEWLLPSLNRATEKLLSTCMHVLQACCEDDLKPVIGEWKGWNKYVVYRPGEMPKSDIIILAQHLMQHGIIGKAKIRKLQRHESAETTNEFRSVDYIVAAQTHFAINEQEASRLTMTKFQMLLAAKYPDQKGFTREEYDQVADEFLAAQAARRAA